MAVLVATPRRWKLRNPRNDGGRPLSACERRIWPGADLYRLISDVIAQALEDVDAGWHGDYRDYGTANERYWRAHAYLFFFHGDPTGFDKFLARLGIDGAGRLPSHPLFDDPAVLRARRCDLAVLGLPVDLFDRRLAQMELGEAG